PESRSSSRRRGRRRRFRNHDRWAGVFLRGWRPWRTPENRRIEEPKNQRGLGGLEPMYTYVCNSAKRPRWVNEILPTWLQTRAARAAQGEMAEVDGPERELFLGRNEM